MSRFVEDDLSMLSVVRSSVTNADDIDSFVKRSSLAYSGLFKNCGSRSPGDPGFQDDNDCAKGDSAGGFSVGADSGGDPDTGSDSPGSSDSDADGGDVRKSSKVTRPKSVKERRLSRWMMEHEGDLVKGTGAGGDIRLIDAATFFNDLIPASQKIDDYSEKNIEKLAQAMAEEGEYAHSVDPSATTWYTEDFEKAMGIVAEKHPEVGESEAHRSLFTMMMVINSNGTDVLKNFEHADDMYSAWKRVGNLPESMVGGPAAKAINQHFRMLQGLIDNLGVDGTHQFLTSKMSPSQLTAMGYSASGESVKSDVTYGAHIFGPKLGAFFANLRGDRNLVTMDRWFMRTVNRMRGTLLVPNEKRVAINSSKMLRVIEDLDDESLHGIKRDKLVKAFQEASETGVMKRTSAAFKFIERQLRVYAKDYSVKSDENMLAKTLHENVTGLQESPGGTKDREFLRAVTSRAADIMREKGIDLTPADLQAVLWYSEKRLWSRAGVGTRRSAPLGYKDAAAHVMLGKPLPASYSGEEESEEELEVSDAQS